MALDRLMGRNAWQERVAGGAAMVDASSAWTRCAGGDASMPKIRKLDMMIAGVFLAFLFTWHYRADFIESWRAAVAANKALAQECR